MGSEAVEERPSVQWHSPERARTVQFLIRGCCMPGNRCNPPAHQCRCIDHHQDMSPEEAGPLQHRSAAPCCLLPEATYSYLGCGWKVRGRKCQWTAGLWCALSLWDDAGFALCSIGRKHCIWSVPPASDAIKASYLCRSCFLAISISMLPRRHALKFLTCISDL